MGKIKLTGSCFALLFLVTNGCLCQAPQAPKLAAGPDDIANTIINDEDSIYYIDFSDYPARDSDLPIGVFDSGTGGLTVLRAIVNYDRNNNESFAKGSDGRLDFEKEVFIYLGDQANMPYGNYSEVGKVDLLREHIIKDAQFLLGNKYYSDAMDKTVNTDKRPIKAMVVACNTATAYGKESIEEFLKKANANIRVIGVIDAGVRGTLEGIAKDENAVIGVLATAGTISSKGYQKAILELKEEWGYTGDIKVFSQGGIGIAEAVDEDPDYFDRTLQTPRKAYRGPALEGKLKIDKALYESYNFNFDRNKMLCDSENLDDCSILQINDAENYVRYHLVTLLEKIRKSNTNNQLKSIILGCTHYPYLSSEIKMVLEELYNYRAVEGKYRYRAFMAKDIQLINPAVDTAKELYAFLKEQALLNKNGDMGDSEFYISVANRHNENNIIGTDGRFPYDFKYGRNAGEIQEYTKIVPFSRRNISEDILLRIKEQIPRVYELMQNFNKSSAKTQSLAKKDKI